jgi:transcription initiation factor TFIIH subunit 2
MADSDGEYVDNISDDEPSAHQVTTGGDYDTRTSGRGRVSGRQAGKPKARWEDIQRSWDNVVEGADGSINSTVTGFLEASKRQRYELSVGGEAQNK